MTDAEEDFVVIEYAKGAGGAEANKQRVLDAMQDWAGAHQTAYVPSEAFGKLWGSLTLSKYLGQLCSEGRIVASRKGTRCTGYTITTQTQEEPGEDEASDPNTPETAQEPITPINTDLDDHGAGADVVSAVAESNIETTSSILVVCPQKVRGKILHLEDLPQVRNRLIFGDIPNITNGVVYIERGTNYIYSNPPGPEMVPECDILELFPVQLVNWHMLFEKLRGSALSVPHKTLYLRNINRSVQQINTIIRDAAAADFDTLLDEIGDVDVHLTAGMFFQFEEWCDKYARDDIHQTLYITLLTGDGAFARAIALLKMRALKKNVTLNVTVMGWPHSFSRSNRAGHSFAEVADKIVSLTDIIPHCLEFGSVTPRTVRLYETLGLLGMPKVLPKPATEPDLQKSA